MTDARPRRSGPPAGEPDGPRLFVAVPLSSEVMAAVADLVAGVRLAREPGPGERRDPLDVRWIRMDGLHLTLRFLGPTDPGRLPEAEAAVRAAVPGSAPFEVGLAGAGVFPNPARPRVLWLGIGRGIDQ
ncbi:MAG TPA: 2'-5' RNA ligase family protein, partial [Candidatus Limnocylindrales bacterium]